ncbi:MAG: glycosyl hydrolase [Bacteroidia bacterium]
MKKCSLPLILLGLLATISSLSAQSPLFEWPEVSREARPWTRWWWPGSAVDSANITWNLSQIAAAGFGGVEITPIYGARGQESRFLPYLSPAWVNMLDYTLEEAYRLGLFVDIPPGSGWRTGGPWVKLEDADSKLEITATPLTTGTKWKTDFGGKRILAVMAYGPGQVLDLMPRMRKDSSLRWKVPAGDWTIWTAEMVFRGGNVKRPAPGGEGYSISPYSSGALSRFLEAYDQRVGTLPHGPLHSYFHDSFEYTGDVSREIFDRFLQIKGYDLREHLPALSGKGWKMEVESIQADYREVLGLILRDDFFTRFSDWAHAKGSQFRNQAHGSPGNLLDLYALADIPETEIFGPLSGPDANRLINRFASSAAHVAGRPLASSESCTWLGEHFTVGLDSIKAAIDHLWLGGINHVFFHGTVYSPQDVPWPGWLFYASVQMNPQNPLWKDVPALSQYITRGQAMLQDGTPDNDILLYWPYHDVIEKEGDLKQQLVVHNPTWFSGSEFGRIAQKLEEGGYAFDYISDRQLQNSSFRDGKIFTPGGTGYRLVIIPGCDYMPMETAQAVEKLARTGAKFIMESHIPRFSPGWKNKAENSQTLVQTWQRILTSTPVALVPDVFREMEKRGIRREVLSKSGELAFIRRKNSLGTQYLVVNEGNKPYSGYISLATGGKSVILMDPVSGQTGKGDMLPPEENLTRVFVQLPPKASLFIKVYNENVEGPRWKYEFPGGEKNTLSGSWKVEFLSGGPSIPPKKNTDTLTSWTDWGKQEESFAGTARYSLTFDDPGTGKKYILNLGKVAETATIYLNGAQIATRIIAPYSCTLPTLKPEGNLLEIEVTNLAANRIRELDRRGVNWKNFYDINFVNRDYKKFDASEWPTYESGLIGPVTLEPVSDKAYIFSYFTGNGEDGLHLALSRDGVKWEALNDGNSYLTPLVGESKLMRDPCITRGPDGEYHMVWTTSWSGTTIGYAHSKDLIHWSEQQAIPVMAHESKVQNCWAPEIIYDEPEGHYVIFWSSTIPGRFPKTDKSERKGQNHRMYYTTTRDFETFSPTRLFFDQGFNVIDGSIIRTGDRYAMFVKNESLFPSAEKNIRLTYADNITGPWTDVTPPVTGDYWAEGPTAAQINGKWFLYFDKYTQHKYGLLTSTDLQTWEDHSAELKMPEGIRHGTVLEISGEEASLLLQSTTAAQPEKTSGSRTRRPNILIAISDDQSYPHTSAYGSASFSTPGFDRVAREGILFTQAFVASPGCSPSRAALLTGRNCWQLEEAGTHASSFPKKYITFPDLLEAAGYHAGYTGKGWGPGNWAASERYRNPAGTEWSNWVNESPAGISTNDYATNFEKFLKDRPENQPFCFWYGAFEPHRVYQEGIGAENGINPDSMKVPGFLPDVATVRSDMADYAYEISWFDAHLARMLRTLEAAGELENTIVIVTADNGMPFPRAKANAYEYGIHVPLAIRWGENVKAGRVVDDLVSMTDIAPTLLEAAGVTHPGDYPMSGRSLMNVLSSPNSGVVDPSRTAVYAARERHSSSRYKSLGYPQRCVRTADYLYIRNYKPERWPAGPGAKYGGLMESDLWHHELGYYDIDDSPTLRFMIQNADSAAWGKYLTWAVGKRPAEELYAIQRDPDCLVNLAGDSKHQAAKEKLSAQLSRYLKETGDPRELGSGDVWETYRRYSPLRQFPEPDWAKQHPEWVPGR